MNMAHFTNSPEDLFVHISCRTQDGKPLLADDEVRQAAHLAVRTCIRTLRCRVLALRGTCNQLDVVVQFPASVPVSQIARCAMQAAGESVSHLMGTAHSHRRDTVLLWERHYTTCTLSAGEAAEAEAYLCRQAAD